MSFHKAIKHKKEKRKPYLDSRDFDSSCLNHKGCPWCEGNRKRRQKILEEKAEQEMIEFLECQKDEIMKMLEEEYDRIDC